MAQEKALWQRVRNGVLSLRKMGHKAHYCRIENDAGVGNPDVDACLDGGVHDIELKSEERPKRTDTKIRFKVKPSQSIWHGARTEAGSRHHWVLAQVGDARDARLYLIPGNRYDEIVAPEDELDLLSVIDARSTVEDVLLRAAKGW